jgi:hypothetical protein
VANVSNIKKIISIIFFAFITFGVQAQFFEQFTDGGFNANPNWNGTESDFTVNTEKILTLNVTNDDGVAYLSTENTLKENLSFSFYLKLDFKPSVNDFVRIYLMSSVEDLTQEKEAYLLQINENHNLQFVKQEGNRFTVLKSMLDSKIIDGIETNIKVEKIGTCKWIFSYKSKEDIDYIKIDSLIEMSELDNNYFGFLFNYSALSKANFYIDDVFVEGIDRPTQTSDTLKIKKIVATENAINLELRDKIKDNEIANQTNRFLIDGIENIASIDVINATTLRLTPSKPLEKNKIYQLNIKHIELCSNDEKLNDSLLFAFTDVPQKQDIVINEVMFNTSKAEYIEFYNNTNKLFQLKDIVFAKASTITQTETDEINFSNENYFILPNDYFVFTRSKEDLSNNFTTANTEKLIETDLPTLDDEEDIVILKNIENKDVDRFKYNTSLHSSLLDNTKDVSLERINASTKTQDKNNWYSASKMVGYATPTQKNSAELNLNLDNIKVEPEVFSPDQDGYNDILTLTYKFDEPASVANLHIYNAEGRIVKTILKDEILQEKGFFIWDGTDSNGNKASVGIYFIILDVVETNGRKTIFKEKCVLATPLN